MYPRTRQNRVPSIHERDILGLVLAERIYWLCKTVDAGTMTIKDRRERGRKRERGGRKREREVGASFLSIYGKRDGWWFPVWHRALDSRHIRHPALLAVLQKTCETRATPQWKVYQSLNIRGYGLKYGRAAVCLSEDFPTAMCSWHGASSKLFA